MPGRMLLKKALRDLRASLGQTIALSVIVALGVASLVAMAGAYRDLGRSYQRTYDELHLADVTFALQGAPDSALASIAAVPGVKAVTGRLIADVGLVLPGGEVSAESEQIRSRLIGIPSGRHPEVNDVLVLSGRYLKPGDSASVLLESHFAHAYGLVPGDSVTPVIEGRRVALRVVGVVASPEYLIVSPSKQEIIPSARTFAVLFVPRDDLARLLGRPGTVNDLSVALTPDANSDSTVSILQERLAGWGPIQTTLQNDQPSVAALSLDLEGYRELADLVPGLILLVAAFALYVMLSRLVRSQRPQIGLMRALGYSRRSVVGFYLAVALSIGLLGSIAGAVAGVPLNRAVTSSYAHELGIPLVSTHLHFDLVAIGVVASLVVAAVAGLGPARASVRLDPARAMQLDPSEALVRGRRAPGERLFRLPLWLRLPMRSVFRVRRRSVSTALGIVFAYILVLVGLGMISAMDRLMYRTFHMVERWDASAFFSSPQPEAVLDTVRTWPGVTGVAPLLQSPARLEANGRAQDVLLTALEPGQRMHDFGTERRRPVELKTGRVVLTSALAGQFGLRDGDTVAIKTPLGTVRLPVGATADELMTSVVYVTLGDVQRWTGAPAPVFNGLYLTVDSTRAQTIKRQLYSLPGASSVQLKSRVEKDWASLMGLLNVFMGVILAFAVAMAFALLFNAMTINVLERQRELATMRTIGASRSRIALLIAVENLILWVITLVPGLVLGWWVARRMGDAFQSDLFSFTVNVGLGDFVIAALGILATLLLASLPAIRRVNRINLADAVKILT